MLTTFFLTATAAITGNICTFKALLNELSILNFVRHVMKNDRKAHFLTCPPPSPFLHCTQEFPDDLLSSNLSRYHRREDFGVDSAAIGLCSNNKCKNNGRCIETCDLLSTYVLLFINHKIVSRNKVKCINDKCEKSGCFKKQ